MNDRIVSRSVSRFVSRTVVVRAPAQRGFIVFIVLAVLAIVSAIVVSQFSVATNNLVIGVRSGEDAQARAFAEDCLTMLQEYVDAEVGSPIPAGKDFDEVLNPNGSAAADGSIAIDGDEFLPCPAGGSTCAIAASDKVTLPKGIPTSTLNAFVQLHTWLLIPRGSGASRGACLVRFDDNSDDAMPLSSLPLGAADDVDEGLGQDVPFKDRDRSIYLNAIGIFPFLPGTAAADAYAKAHARVTLRRLYATASTPQPTILAGGDISGLKGALCSASVGAVSATAGAFKSGPVGSSDGCACGSLVAAGALPDAPSAVCTATADCPCAPVTRLVAPLDTANLAMRLDAKTPPTDTFEPAIGASGTARFVLDNESFGAPALRGAPSLPPIANNLSGKDLGADLSSCKLYFERSGKVFVWNRSDATCEPYTLDPVADPAASTCWVQLATVAAGSTWNPVKAIGSTGKEFGAAKTDAKYLCGADGSGATAPIPNCSSCDGTRPAAQWDGTAWSFSQTTDNVLPTPSYLIVDNASSATETLLDRLGDGSTSGYLHASVVSLQTVSTTGIIGLCGVGCDCATLPAPSALATCARGVASIDAAAASSCSAIRTFGRYAPTDTTSKVIVGDIRAGYITDAKGSTCYIGDLAAMQDSPSSSRCDSVPSGTSCSGDAFMCLDSAVNVVGDLYAKGTILIDGGTISGEVTSRQSFCSASNAQVLGGLVVGENAGFKGHSTKIAGGNGVVRASLRAMVETTW